MRAFSVMSCGFLHSYGTVRLPDRLSPVQNLTLRPKVQTYWFSSQWCQLN